MSTDSLLKCLTVLTMALLSNGCNPSRAVNGPRVESRSQLQAIGLALRDYEESHGALPRRFSNLVPKEVALEDLKMFYVTNSSTQKQSLPKGWNTRVELIDEYSSYVYLGTNGLNGVIAHERTNLWKETASHSNLVAVLFSDYHVEYLSIEQVLNSSRRP